MKYTNLVLYGKKIKRAIIVFFCMFLIFFLKKYGKKLLYMTFFSLQIFLERFGENIFFEINSRTRKKKFIFSFLFSPSLQNKTRKQLRKLNFKHLTCPTFSVGYQQTVHILFLAFDHRVCHASYIYYGVYLDTLSITQTSPLSLCQPIKI